MRIWKLKILYVGYTDHKCNPNDCGISCPFLKTQGWPEVLNSQKEIYIDMFSVCIPRLYALLSAAI